jgi:hypothetical protein
MKWNSYLQKQRASCFYYQHLCHDKPREYHPPPRTCLKYSGRKITESLGNVTVRGEKYGKSKRGARLSTVCLSMYSITENIYCSQLSSVAILLQPERNCFTSYNTRKWYCFLFLCAIVLRSPPASHVSSSNGQWSSQLFCAYYRLRYLGQDYHCAIIRSFTQPKRCLTVF